MNFVKNVLDAVLYVFIIFLCVFTIAALVASGVVVLIIGVVLVLLVLCAMWVDYIVFNRETKDD